MVQCYPWLFGRCMVGLVVVSKFVPLLLSLRCWRCQAFVAFSVTRRTCAALNIEFHMIQCVLQPSGSHGMDSTGHDPTCLWMLILQLSPTAHVLQAIIQHLGDVPTRVAPGQAQDYVYFHYRA